MPEWTGALLYTKRKQALDALRSSMSDMLSHDEWIQLTETLWQCMSDKVIESQFDVLRKERFDPKEEKPTTAESRLLRFSKYRRVLRALNFVFKCYEVDWSVFLDTLVALAEGRVDVRGFDSPARRDQQNDQATSAIEGPNDSGSSQ